MRVYKSYNLVSFVSSYRQLTSQECCQSDDSSRKVCWSIFLAMICELQCAMRRLTTNPIAKLKTEDLSKLIFYFLRRFGKRAVIAIKNVSQRKVFLLFQVSSAFHRLRAFFITLQFQRRRAPLAVHGGSGQLRAQRQALYTAFPGISLFLDRGIGTPSTRGYGIE